MIYFFASKFYFLAIFQLENFGYNFFVKSLGQSQAVWWVKYSEKCTFNTIPKSELKNLE